MIIALTGTPGTGKTTASEIIKNHPQFKNQYHIIDINKLILKEKLYSGKDDARDTYEADMDKVKERIKQEIRTRPQNMDIIMEGHFSHLLPADAIIVLRVHPVILRQRLEKRKNYSLRKINENYEAEALDVILVESVESNANVFEINTTDKDAICVVQSVVSIIEAARKGKVSDEFIPGSINWIDQVEITQELQSP